MKFDMNGSQAVIRQTSVSYQAVIRQFSGSRQIVMYLKGLYIIMYFLQKDDIMLNGLSFIAQPIVQFISLFWSVGR